MKKYHRIFFGLLLLGFAASFGMSIYFFLKTLHTNVVLANEKDIKEPVYHFILIPEEMDNPYWRSLKKGAADAGRHAGAAIEYIGPVQTNTDEQIKIIEKAIASKVDGIITQGIDKPAFKDAIHRAKRAGIPVITIDTDAPDSERSTYIGSDNYLAGYLAGQTLIKGTNGHAVVGIITGNYNPNEKLRVKGFQDAVSKQSGIKIAGVKSSNISRIQAAEKTYEMFQKHPDITAFYGTSALDGLGIAAVAEKFGKAKDLYIISFDALPETLNLLGKGVIDATVKQKPYAMGHKSVQTMVQLLHHHDPPKILYTETTVIKKADIMSEKGGRGND
ncbi:monosaccharide ABC transporter substrate-binding protein (CUT2 family) [Scopulibacillus darangshiensis]|uniref:Monosaccharide ABC transporter substrate-binding protein (CUT2 family) n=1 Tax=Scopulibacillus darangshiensis TaxID=442528 RepID=A0A4R2P9P5_9BACL|nr:sugar-binding protein [Scopulibacillus darangshiensis]TCP31759.1 monosaccharide ABC transporter substrate-binding protein (CUT2 family) [Scopulibacillus darangshiensis]